MLHVRPCSDVTRIWGRYQTVHCPLFPSQSGGQVSSPKLATEDEVARTAQLGCMPRGMSGSAAREGEEAEEGGDRKGGSPRRKGAVSLWGTHWAGDAGAEVSSRECWCAHVRSRTEVLWPRVCARGREAGRLFGEALR